MKRLLALLALLAPTVACDQATKVLAVQHLKGHAAVDLVGGFFRFTYAENPGAFLSLGRSLPDSVRQPLLVLVVGLMLLGVTVVLVRKRMATLPFVALALLVAGGLGNLIDRVARDGGRVVDFAQLRVPGGPFFLSTGVFNVADLYIVAAAVVMGVLAWRRPDPGPTQQPSDSPHESAA